MALCMRTHVLIAIFHSAQYKKQNRQHLYACIRHLCLERESSQACVLLGVVHNLYVQPMHVFHSKIVEALQAKHRSVPEASIYLAAPKHAVDNGVLPLEKFHLCMQVFGVLVHAPFCMPL
jgi:hypothetical protein